MFHGYSFWSYAWTIWQTVVGYQRDTNHMIKCVEALKILKQHFASYKTQHSGMEWYSLLCPWSKFSSCISQHKLVCNNQYFLSKIRLFHFVLNILWSEWIMIIFESTVTVYLNELITKASMSKINYKKGREKLLWNQHGCKFFVCNCRAIPKLPDDLPGLNFCFLYMFLVAR